MKNQNHYVTDRASGKSVCGKDCKMLPELPTDIDLQTGVMGKLTQCEPCLQWYANITGEVTVYLGAQK
jgi:hypothetical protein